MLDMNQETWVPGLDLTQLFGPQIIYSKSQDFHICKSEIWMHGTSQTG